MVDADKVRLALARWCDALEAAAPELNGLDGRLGDGDLGTTLQRCAVLVREALPGMGDELASVFKACAAASAKASPSSRTVPRASSTRRASGANNGSGAGMRRSGS